MLTLAIMSTIFLGLLTTIMIAIIRSGEEENTVEIFSYIFLVFPLLFAIVTIWVLYSQI